MKFHIHTKITKTGQTQHTGFTFDNEEKAQGLIELINKFGNGEVTAFINRK